MKTSHRHLLVALLFLLAVSALPSSLRAQASKIFVASIGNDANDGSRGSPKRNFQAAHDAVAAGGQIVVLDTAGYGTLNISKSLSVTVPPGVNGFITAIGNANGVTIEGASKVGVVLRGLIIEGGGQNAGVGIYASSAANLVIEGCTIRNFIWGVFQTTADSSTSLSDCVLLGCSRGLYLQSLNGSATANVNHCRFELNGREGITVFANPSAGPTITAADSLCYRNNTGIAVTGMGATAKASVLVSNCVITDNATGILASSSGAFVLSRGNNTLSNNAAGSAFTGTYGAQ